MSSNAIAPAQPLESPQTAGLEAVVAGIVDVERQIARLRAGQAGLVADLDRLIGVGLPDAAREELMVGCRITATQARRRLETARALAGRLAHTQAARRRGGSASSTRSRWPMPPAA